MNEVKTEERPHAGPKTYLGIAAVLTVITVVELMATFQLVQRAIPWGILLAALLLLSAAKFALVAGFYMHLRYDKSMFTGFFGFGLFTAAAILMVLFSIHGTGAAAEPGNGDHQPPPEVVTRAKEIFVNAGCGGCHTIQGVSNGRIGPRLDHVASQARIANFIPNTPENMAAWINNPAALKPGTVMPSLGLSQGEISTLVAYLQTLK